MGLRAAYDRAVAARGKSATRASHRRRHRPRGARGAAPLGSRARRWDEVPLPGVITIAVVHDIRAFYEEAALELVDGPPPGGRAAEAWFYEETEAGKTVMAARQALQDQDAPFPFWFYMAPRPPLNPNLRRCQAPLQVRWVQVAATFAR